MKQSNLSMRDLNQIIVTESQRGKSLDDLVAFLRQRGWPEVTARQFVINTLEQRGPGRRAEPAPEAPASGPAGAQSNSLTWMLLMMVLVLILLAL